MNPTLARLYTERDEQTAFIDQLLASVEEEGRDLVDAERRNLEAAEKRIKELDEQIEPLESWEKRREAHRSRIPQPDAQPAPAGQRQALTVEPREVKYRSAGAFVVDLIRARGYEGEKVKPDPEAAQRVEAAMQVRVNQTTTETPGLLPNTIIGEILSDLDGSRPFVNSIGAKDMTSIPGKVFTRPKVTQHTQTTKQAAEKAELGSRQFKVEGVPFTKETFGGWLNVSRQDIDWTSPAAWDALITDLQLEYGADTDDFAAVVFATGVTQVVTYDDESTDRLGELIKALYAAAQTAATAAGTKRASALRLPNHIWVSIDQWASLGTAIDRVRALVMGSSSPGDASPVTFAGSILDVPRTMVPGLPAGSLIVGRTQLFEYYEERVGVLSAVEPKILGVEVAYGGYAASGFLDATGFVKITPDTNTVVG